MAGDGSVVGQRTDERGGVQGTGDHGDIEELWRRQGRAAAGLMGTKRSRNCEQTAGVHQRGCTGRRRGWLQTQKGICLLQRSGND